MGALRGEKRWEEWTGRGTQVQDAGAGDQGSPPGAAAEAQTGRTAQAGAVTVTAGMGEDSLLATENQE